MKQKLVIFHPAIAPYRVDFFNALNDTFEAVFYVEFQQPLEQNFDRKSTTDKLNFRPFLLKPGFAGIKNLRLSCWRILKRENPDLVLISEYNLLGLLVVLYKSVTRSKFRIVTICDDNLSIASSAPWIKRLTRSFLLHNLYGVILTNPAAITWYQERWKSLCRWIYFPIIHKDERFRAELEKALPLATDLRSRYRLDHRKVILYVGRLTPIKNIPLILRAFSKLQDQEPDARLLLVGNGSSWPALENECRQLNIASHVVFAGKQEGPALMAHYALGDIFVLASYYELFGAVINEALLSGCQTLCSSIAGASCLIEENTNGHTYNIYNEDELYLLLKKYLQQLTPPPDTPVQLKANKMPVHFDALFTQLIQQLR